MKQILAIVGAVLFLCGVFSLFIYINTLKPLSDDALNSTSKPTITPTSTFSPTPLPVSYEIPGGLFVSQSFNNCAPATLSMAMSYWNVNVSQDILGQKMRPYQNSTGDNDDKSVSVDEFVTEARNYGLEALERPNGTVELVKQFVSHNIPVVVRTWLHPNEDIGHFRVVRGYDDVRRVFIQDDSYEGKNLIYDYETFLSMWQPFNYGYIIVYPSEKKNLVQEILGEEFSEKVAYENAIVRSYEELKQNPASSYARFNLSSAFYHLKNYQKSVEEFEKIENMLPSRMLWYQIEPILSYKELENAERVFSLTDKILDNNNRAFSELYQARGEIYLSQGKTEEARVEFEKAIFYNKNFLKPEEFLKNL